MCVEVTLARGSTSERCDGAMLLHAERNTKTSYSGHTCPAASSTVSKSIQSVVSAKDKITDARPQQARFCQI